MAKKKRGRSAAETEVKAPRFFMRPLWVLGVILTLFTAINIRTFVLPHANGDEIHYVATALKLDKVGFKSYNIRGIQAVVVEQAWRGYRLMKDVDAKGDVLQDLESDGISYYDTPLYTTPPLLPALIAGGHRLFNSGQETYFALLRRVRFSSLNRKAVLFISKMQAYAVIWPFLFGLLLIAGTFFLGRAVHSDSVALAAALMMATGPVVMLCASKVWADTLVASCACFSVLFFVNSLKENRLWLAGLSGVLLGIGALAKLTALCFAVGFVFYHLWVNRPKLRSLRGIVQVLSDGRMWLFGISFLAVCGPWLWLVHKTYGNPLFQMHGARELGAAVTDRWTLFLQSRPFYLYYVNYPYQMPLIGLAYLAPFVGRRWKNPEIAVRLLLAIPIAVTLWQVRHGREIRYLLHVLPAITIFAAVVLDDWRLRINRLSGGRWGNVLFAASLLASGWWSVRIGSQVVMSGSGTLDIPF